MGEIFLIRHGETAANAARIVQRPDVPLSERGLVQAARLAERLAAAGIVEIATSDYARARMTAELLRGSTRAPLVVWPELRERNFGELRGRAYAEIGLDIFAEGYEPPGGEAWPDFFARVARAWERIVTAARACPGNLAIVSHGLVCRAIIERHVRGEPPDVWHNTSLTVLASEPPYDPRLMNCIEHLGALEPVPSLDSLGRA